MGARGPKSDKLWADAVRLAVLRPSNTADENGKKLRRLNVIAENLARMAEEGDMPAIIEIGNRLDGKPAQAVQLSGDAENPVSVEHSASAKLAAFLNERAK